MYDILRQRGEVYSSKMLKKHLYRIVLSKDSTIRQRSIEEAFFLLSKITLRKIDNVFNYFIQQRFGLYVTPQQVQSLVTVTKDDLASECFLIFNRCLQKFDIKRIDSFYFYYNKTLIRELPKAILKDDLNLHNVDITSMPEKLERMNIHKTTYSDHEPQMLNEAFRIYRLSSIEKLIIRSKMKQETVKEFTVKMKITSVAYYAHLKSAKRKLTPFYEELTRNR